MKHKLFATVAASALALGVSAAAQADAHPYAGFSAGYFQGDANRDLGDASTLGAQVGYHFNQDWSVEAAYGADNGLINPRERNLAVSSLSAAYRLWSNDSIAVLGLVGAQYTNMDHKFSDVKDNSTQGTLGVALSHYFTDQIELRGSVVAGYTDALEWNDYYTTVALNYHFGTHGAKAAEPVAAAPAPVAKKAEPVVIMKKTLHAHFDHDSTIVKAEDKKEVADVAAAMKNNPGSKAELVGHTDSTGTDAYNQKLSEKRAAAVKAELVKQGASADAITTSGKGETVSVGDNATAAGRAANRRVEATVTGQ